MVEGNHEFDNVKSSSEPPSISSQPNPNLYNQAEYQNLDIASLEHPPLSFIGKFF